MYVEDHNVEVLATKVEHCPGLYCGRTQFENGSWSTCGACLRGYRASFSTAVCLPCMDPPTFYDWLYLGFMVLVLLVFEWYVIDQTLKRRNFTREIIGLHASALVENALAAVLTVLLIPPTGCMTIYSCGVVRLADWYTLLHNPSPGYQTTLRCTQEAVYPLYSMIFIHYSLALAFMLLLRPLLVKKLLGGAGKRSVYLTMYVIPGLVVLQATCGGLLYYSFPYIVIILSVVSVAAHFAFRLDQSMVALIIHTVFDMRNLVILVGHCFLHAYGIIAVTQLKDPVFHGMLLMLVPFPALFYILTSKFTDPSKLHSE